MASSLVRRPKEGMGPVEDEENEAIVEATGLSVEEDEEEGHCENLLEEENDDGLEFHRRSLLVL